MIEWLFARTSALASVWNFFVLFLFLFLFDAALFRPMVMAICPAKSFDGRIAGFWPSEAPGILGEFKAADKLDLYEKQETTIDAIFPMVYTLFFAVGIVVVGRGTRLPRWLIAVPYLAGLSDYLENATFVAMIRGYRATGTVPYPLAVAATVASRLKWGFILLALVALSCAVLLRLWLLLRSRQAP